MRFAAIAMVLSACGTLAPREYGGPTTKPTDGGPSLPPPPPGLLVAAERYDPGGHLVFVNEHGTRVGDLTEPPAGATVDVTPAWSPDGRYVAFASSRERDAADHTSIWITRVDRSRAPIRLTHGDGIDLAPSWSPEGRRIVFASRRAGGGGFDLWILDLEPDGQGDLRVRTEHRLTSSDAEEFAPCWSHHGDRIAYTSATARGQEKIMIIHPDGGAATVVTDGAYASFAPDDRTLVFVAPGGDEGSDRKDNDLWLVDVDGAHRRKLVDARVADEGMPRFSADGRFVLATSVVRAAGRVMYAALVAVDLQEARPKLRALQDKIPAPRLGVDVAPQPLDAAVLDAAPDLEEALHRVLAPD